MEALPLVLKGCNIKAYTGYPGPWSWEGSSLYSTSCCDKGPQFLRSQLKDHTDLVLLATRKGSKVPFLTLIIFETFLLDYNESTFYQ